MFVLLTVIHFETNLSCINHPDTLFCPKLRKKEIDMSTSKYYKRMEQLLCFLKNMITSQVSFLTYFLKLKGWYGPEGFKKTMIYLNLKIHIKNI